MSPNKLLSLCGIASVVVATIIVAMKAYTWGVTESVAVLGALVDGVLDILTSLINLLAIHYALQPPDKEHRFGHGKAEDLAALSQAVFISASACFVLFEGIHRLYRPQAVMNAAEGMEVLLLSTVLTGMLVAFQTYVIKRSNSKVVRADRLHYVSDIALNGAVFLGLLASSFFGGKWLDPLLGVAVGGFILKGAVSLGKNAFNHLMDHEFDTETRERIKSVIAAHPDVIGYHDLRTRISGGCAFIQFHLEMNGQITLYQAHHISDEIEKELKAQFPQAEILVHQDPR